MLPIPRCLEFLALKVSLGPILIIGVGIYRPPSADFRFIDATGDLLSQNIDTKLIVMGDIF